MCKSIFFVRRLDKIEKWIKKTLHLETSFSIRFLYYSNRKSRERSNEKGSNRIGVPRNWKFKAFLTFLFPYVRKPQL